jgi:hypothetical protein
MCCCQSIRHLANLLGVTVLELFLGIPNIPILATDVDRENRSTGSRDLLLHCVVAGSTAALSQNLTCNMLSFVELHPSAVVISNHCLRRS